MNIPSEICLLNDCFPPSIDGVSNTVINYGRVLSQDGQAVSVVVPHYPGADDSGFPYPVIRYPSFDVRKKIGYTAGNPFSFNTLLQLKKRNIGILHSHCPFTSSFMARELKEMMDVPFVITYHTKFDVDIGTIVKLEAVQQAAIRILLSNVNCCDELWTVSDGAGKNVQKLGYKGDYIVMPNGVDIPRGRATQEEIHAACEGYDLPQDIPLFLYVGRMRWYKGIRLLLDALGSLHSQSIPFRMVFVGGGKDEDAIKAYASELRLDGCCFFTGAIRERSVLKAWYSRANLMLFPSTFDTNGLVVREAAACNLGSVLIKDSCAAEGVTHMTDGVLVEETPASLAAALVNLIHHPEQMQRIGENASANLYLSWDDAVHMAKERYGIVMEEYHRNPKPHKNNLRHGPLEIYGDMMNLFGQFKTIRKEN